MIPFAMLLVRGAQQVDVMPFVKFNQNVFITVISYTNSIIVIDAMNVM